MTCPGIEIPTLRLQPLGSSSAACLVPPAMAILVASFRFRGCRCVGLFADSNMQYTSIAVAQNSGARVLCAGFSPWFLLPRGPFWSPQPTSARSLHPSSESLSGRASTVLLLRFHSKKVRQNVVGTSNPPLDHQTRKMNPSPAVGIGRDQFPLSRSLDYWIV